MGKSSDSGSVEVPVEYVIKKSNLNEYPSPRVEKEIVILFLYSAFET